MAATIHETIEQLHEALKDYIEAVYHIADPRLIEQRREILDTPGVVHQVPYLESTPKYRTGARYKDIRGLSRGALEAFETLSAKTSSGRNVIYDPAYTHQVKALEDGLIAGKNLVIMTGTGSGKTESFLLPILGKLAREASERPKVFSEQAAMRALVLYPMNALVNDQLGRLRAMFGDHRLVELFCSWAGRPARFARYTSRTPYAGVRNRKKDQRRLKSFEDFYVDLERASSDADNVDHAAASALKHELYSRGKWPAKPDLREWFGEKNTAWESKGVPSRAVTRTRDAELITRHEAHKAPPDLLVTNYSMLEYMLMRPIERPVFDKTAEWLRSNPDERFLVVLDEAHLYRGAPGAEVGLLLRRLRARLGIPVERLQVICATASFEDSTYAPSFGAQLSGAPARSFVAITGDLASPAHADTGSLEDAQVLADMNLDAFYGGPTLRQIAVRKVLAHLGVSPTDNTERDLYEGLKGFPALGLLIRETMRKATPLEALSSMVFTQAVDNALGDKAITALLAIGSVARPSPNEAGLLPCRVHNFFRGLPGLWVCPDAECSALATEQRNGFSGKLYGQPRERCGCGAQILEYFTCRDCGSSYARGYTDNLESPRHVWSHPGSRLHLSNGEVEPLFPLDLLLEEPQKPEAVEVKSFDLVTAALDPNHEGLRMRSVYIRKDRQSGVVDDENYSDTRLEVRGQFSPCGVCGETAAFARSSVQDHQTKGDQPFQALVARQLAVQPPGQKEATAFAPLQGRKVLAFSDSRQVAARLAPNLQMYSTRDSLRPMLVLGFEELARNPRIAQRLSLDDAYLAVLLAAARFKVRLRPELVPGESLAAVERVRSAVNADCGPMNEDEMASLWMDIKDEKTPSALLDDIYKSLFNKHLGLEPLALASLAVRMDKQSKLAQLPDLPGLAVGEQQKLALVEFWLRCWWRAPSPVGLWMRDMPDTWWQRGSSSGTSIRPHKGSFQAMKRLVDSKPLMKKFESEWLPTLIRELTQEVEGQRRLFASHLSLRFTGAWQRCETCKSVHRPLVLRPKCIDCGSPRVANLDPLNDAAFVARKGNYRKPVLEARQGKFPLALIAAEHTAQLNSAGSEDAFSRAEEHELLFQDVELTWKGLVRNPTAIDVLSSTTTMEVGIDIGALSGVALRNMPPGRANYQQRAGRAGRRGTAVATVVSFGSADSHDEHYFSNPEAMVSGPVVDPTLALSNPDIARRHVRAFLLQAYHQARVPTVSAAEAPDLFSVLGTVADFKSQTGRLNQFDFEAWLKSNLEVLADQVRDWLPDELREHKVTLVSTMVDDCVAAVSGALDGDAGSPRESNGEAQGYEDIAGENGQEEAEEHPSNASAPATLLNRLLYFGILPRYAFPTDVATFTVLDEQRSTSFRHVARFAPSQSLPIALSQYAPGKEVWIANKCYTSSALYSPFKSELNRAYKDRVCYRECTTCGFAETKDVSELERGTSTDCMACGDAGTFGPARYWMRPPGFAHLFNRAPVTSPEDSPDTAYATRAKLMIATPADDASWIHVNERVRVLSSRQHLLVSNTGPEKKGYTYCSWCGLIEADTEATPKLRGSHSKPYPDKEPLCEGHPTKHLVLGTKFITDVALFSFRLNQPLGLRPGTYPTIVALRTVSEALAKAAAEMLAIEPGELLAEFRPAITKDAAGRQGLEAEVFLYDTLPGGAGFARLAAQDAGRLLKGALRLMRSCAGHCESSCYRCLRSFKNKVEHRLLDRHVGIELVEHLLTGVTPTFASTRATAAGALLFNALKQQAEAGEHYEANVRVSGGDIPVVATRADGKRTAVFLAAPLSGNVAMDEDLRILVETSAGWTSVVVNELLVRHHLPAACREVQKTVRPND